MRKIKIKKGELSFIFHYALMFKGYISSLIVLSGISALFGVGFSLLMREFIDTATGRSNWNIGGMWVVAWIMGAAILLNLLITSLSTYITAKIKLTVSNAIKRDIYKKWLTTDWLALSSYHSGDLMSRINNDVPYISNMLLDVIPSAIALSLQFLASAAVLFYLDPMMSLIAIVAGPFLLLASRYFAKRLKVLQKKSQERESRYYGFMQESMQNMTVIRSFNLNDKYDERLGDLQQEHMSIHIKRTKLSIASSLTMGILQYLTYFAALGWGAFRLHTNSISYGDMTAFLQLANQVRAPISGMAGLFSSAVSAFASAERLLEILNLPTEADIKDEDKIDIAKGLSLVCENISFAYVKDDLVLRDINIEANPGETVALMGHSGEGKTTIIRLLLGLIKPVNGKIYIKNEKGEKREISRSARDYFSYVPQGNTIFSGTIEENLKMGREDATRDEIITALKAAACWDFVSKLPNDIAAVVGERGVGLSEGQAQRIAIARALLRKSPILLLDEATSALDAQTEKDVLLCIHQNYADRTCIVISHRPKIIEYCNRVYKLSEGKLTKDETD